MSDSIRRTFAVADPEAAGEYVQLMHDSIRAMEHELWLSVGAMHYAGMSWSQIAEHVGLNSRQAAMYRYKGARETFAQLLEQQHDPDEYVREAAVAEVQRVERQLSIRPVRIKYRVRLGTDREAEVVSEHYVEARARERANELHAADGGNYTVWEHDPRTRRDARLDVKDSLHRTPLDQQAHKVGRLRMFDA